MPKLEFFLVAEDVSVDQVTNRLSLFNVLDTAQIAHFPILIPKCCVVTLWRKDPGDEERDFQALIVVSTPNGQNHRIETNFRIINSRHRIMNRIQGLPVLAPGELKFELLLNGKHIASHVASFELLPQDAAGGPEETRH